LEGTHEALSLLRRIAYLHPILQRLRLQQLESNVNSLCDVLSVDERFSEFNWGDNADTQEQFKRFAAILLTRG
jgi:hypothetical protein